MTGHSGPITSLSFSAESSVLVSGSLDSTVRCWDVKSAGGEKSTSMRSGSEHDASNRRANSTVTGVEHGELPLGGAPQAWDGAKQTSVTFLSYSIWITKLTIRSDLLATFPTKRTPIIKAHHTPRNLCMVAGSFIAPSNTDGDAA